MKRRRKKKEKKMIFMFYFCSVITDIQLNHFKTTSKVLYKGNYKRILNQLRLLQPIWLLRPWDFPGKSTGVGCHCLLLHVPSVITKL